jgi:hypothetical protein
LAWAITVHKVKVWLLTKRQSMFRRFYARTSICCLSRLRSLEGLVLLSVTNEWYF